MQGREVELGGLEPKKTVNGDGAVDKIVTEPANDNSGIQKKSKWPWIVGIVVIVLLIGVLVGLIIWRPWKEENENGGRVGQIDSNGDTSVIIPDEGVVKVDIESDLVQSVYNRINTGGGPHAGVGRTYFWTDLLWNGGSDDVVLKLAFLNTAETQCKVVTDRVVRVGEESWPVQQLGVCKDGATIRQKMREIFGREVSLIDGTQIAYTYIYDEQADEFWSYEGGGGGGPVPFVMTEIYDAEKSGDFLYIYEYAATSCVIKVGSSLEEDGCKYVIDPQTEPHVVQWFQISDVAVSGGPWDNLAGERIAEIPTMGPYVELDENGALNTDWQDEVAAVKLSDYAQAVGRYKWTFRDDGTGNYVFVKLERE